MATNNVNGNKSLSANLLPKFYQTSANKKFLQSTIDQLFQPGTITKLTGYAGRKNAKAAVGTDVYLEAPETSRQNYQLEPGIVIQDKLGNVTFFKDYIDYINQINTFNGNTSVHSRLNQQEFYSWDPHIDWDKFVNFQNYYWLPYGPDTISIFGSQKAAESTFSVKIENEGSNNQFVFTPDGLTPNPVLKLYKGQTYTFEINSPGNPFSFKTARSIGPYDRYSFQNTINAQGVETGTITFTIPNNAPSILFYQSETDVNLGGAIEVQSELSKYYINVEDSIIGKKSYTLPDGTLLSNGMKVSFAGEVYPEKYAVGQYYVEGVGTAIKLINSNILEITSAYSIDETVEFDSMPFDKEPFDDASGYAGNLDYITINRASRDHNPWSRYNRWFHKDVITFSSTYNGSAPSLDQTARAVRPIIEFEADLKLFNLGTVATMDVDLIDDFTSDVFSIIEGSTGYNIDGIDLIEGMTVLFSGELDPLVKNKIYKVEYIDVRHTNSTQNQIHLVELATPVAGNVVLVRQGHKNQGSMYWYNGTAWIAGQQKTAVNQPPLFDVVDSAGVSFGDDSVYSGTTFLGTKLFSYSIGTGANDSVLGFPLTYQNVSNIGDIVFNFNLLSDTFDYKKTSVVETQGIDVGYLSSLDYAGNLVYVNGWKTCLAPYTQAAIRVYKNSNKTNNFAIDMFDVSPSNIAPQDYPLQKGLDHDDIRVYVNSKRVANDQWTLVKNLDYFVVKFNTDVQLSDIVTIKVFSSTPINEKGYYEIPVNLQNNPLNENITKFTLGEVIDHVDSIIDNIYQQSANGISGLPADIYRGSINGINYVGVFPGNSNLRDLGNITPYGTKFVQHSGPMSLSMYHLATESNNVISSLDQSKEDYNNFKRNFIATASSLGVDGDPVTLVNKILQIINADKPNVAPYYFSDMVPYGACIITNLTVDDYRIKTYPLSAVFSLDKLSDKAVGLYHNGVQLIHGKDYTFSNQGFVVIDNSVDLKDGDTISTYEYDSTDGCFIPATPTKLGMWPKFEPKKFLDTTLVSPREMIQGHDGSLVLAYGDYRDDLILELEKRIYNNIKVKYDPSVFDISDFVPSYNRVTPYTRNEFNNILAPNFYKWTSFAGKDLTTPLNYDRANSFTFNYSNNVAPDGRALPGYWRGVYKWILDTDRPNLCPWEMLGFSEEPSWWTSVYGPAPYTKDNIPMWTDLSKGLIKEPGVAPVVVKKYAKPFLLEHIPVDEYGNLISPQFSGLSQGFVQASIDNNFVFGDGSPVETAWARSSYYAFSVIKTAILMQPAKCFGLLLDRSRIVRNKAGQLIYTATGLRIRPSDVLLPSVYSSKQRVQTAGLINYVTDLIFNYIFSNNLAQYDSYQTDLQTMGVNLSHRLGAFTNQDHFNILLESKTPSSAGNVFVPVEDYKIFLNKSSTIKKLIYSGVIITKISTGFEVKGYSLTQPFFKSYSPRTETGTKINVGGISENYVEWTSGQQYIVGTVVKQGPAFYRVSVAHTAGKSFNDSYFQKLSSLPMVGGVDAYFKLSWDNSEEVVVPYGTTFKTVQDVVDFLLGYGEWLKAQGFVFNAFNTNLNSVANWEASAKEFMFWSTQNWSSGQEKWSDWAPNQPYSYGTVVRYQGDYYSALYNIPVSDSFELDKWEILPGLSNVGSSVISLSPAANGISFTTNMSVVDSLGSSFNPYEVFKVDGTPVSLSHIDSYRDGDTVTYTTKVIEGIYGASFYLVQNEHVVFINNTTIFNDTIYNPASGYRQERLKISGYVTTGWNGGLDIPGFIFDAAKVNEWQPWVDYTAGDIVTYNSYYYSANAFTPASEKFNASQWTELLNKPTAKILPNWTNIATQFTDFYSLETDSFDTAQQKMGQHSIGYQKRQYLDNIIQDDVSEFKFYQGMIREKGTQNVLNKLFDVLSSDNKESLTFFEEWALRVGQYGATNAFEDIEFTLDDGLFTRTNPQATVLVDALDKTINPFVIQQTPDQIYVKPNGYTSSPFPVQKKDSTFLRSAGYVNADDVFVSLKSLDSLVSQPATEVVVGKPYVILSSGTTNFAAIGAMSNSAGTRFVATGVPTGTGTVALDITQIDEGSYIWCAFDTNSGWDVYRFTDTNMRITDATYSNGILTITTQDLVKLPVGSFIGISQYDKLNGFYKIASVSLNTFTVSAKISGLESPFSHQDRVVLFSLVSQRATSIDALDNVVPEILSPGNIVWTDDRGDGKWASWVYNPVYTESFVVDDFYSTDFDYKFGISSAINKIGTIAAIGSSDGTMSIYTKIGTSINWLQHQYLTPPEVSNTAQNGELASVVALSPDGTWLATGSPLVSNVSSNFKGEYNLSSTYSIDDVVSFNELYYKAILDVGANNTPSNTSSFWNQIPYLPANILGTASNLTQQGVVTIYKKDANNNYQLVDSILSPAQSSGENFGSSLVFHDTDLYISASGYNSNTGRVYKMSFGDNVYFSTSYNDAGSSGTTVKVMRLDGIQAGMTVSGTGFNSKQVVESVLTKLVFNAVTNLASYIQSSTTGQNINLSAITTGMSVTGTNVLPGAKVVSTGINSLTGESFIIVSASKELYSNITSVTFGNDNALTFAVKEVVGTLTLVVSSEPDAAPSGVLTFSFTSWKYNGIVGTGEASGNYFGNRLSLSSDSLTFAIAATGGTIGKVYIYKNTGTSFEVAQAITGLDVNFGQSITLSDSASYLAISNDMSPGSTISEQGTVGVYELNLENGLYVKVQDLTYHNPEFNGQFGNKISFMNDSQTLVVYSRNASSKIPTELDGHSKLLTNSQLLYGTPYVNDPNSEVTKKTTFDKSTTRFITNEEGVGRVDVYDKYATKWVFSESLENISSVSDGYGSSFAVGRDNIIVGLPYSISHPDTVNKSGAVYIYNKKPGAFSWVQSRVQVPIVDITKVKKAFLYSKSSQKLLTYLDVIDPIQGKIAGPAEEELTYKTFYDPATYSYSDGTLGVNVDSSAFWSTNQVSQLWWDVRTTKFINPYFEDVAYRNNAWNMLAPGASVDVYEWVSSSMLPSVWDSLTDTPAGLAEGISGTSLYSDSAYSVRKQYNNITKTFTNTYYFWVKNKTLVPNDKGRQLSAQAVSKLIGNPRNQAYVYMSLIGTDSFSLANVLPYLHGTDTVLAIEYWIVENTDKNIHSQWKLVSTDTIVDLPALVEQKWIDSLCGTDVAGRSVPDINLPVKLKYGIENRPRQGMFVNRIEALKQFVEKANIILLQNQISENYDISSLNDYDKEPTTLTGLYDAVLDTDKDLPYANVNLFMRPVMTPIITNGRITGITIVDPGKGYLIAPYIDITGSGEGAKVRAVIDTLGRIVQISVVSQGQGYDNNTIATVRDYSVLVHSDSFANGNWSIYSFDPTYVNPETNLITGMWSRTLTQSYDVRNYWEYANWFASGYNQFTAADYSVKTFSDLNTIYPAVGEIVKVLTAGAGNWLLLEKYADSTSVDWTQSYKVIGIEKGTIQLSSSLYKTLLSAVGYDATTFDTASFDVKAAKELRIILDALKNSIFVNDLKQKYLELFFDSVRYAHSEQLYLDWIFKTSFVRATHNVGDLAQPVYYPIDNLSNFQDYINEVKPYRTTVREYISDYTALDSTNSAVTDFDMPPVYSNGVSNLINTVVSNGKVLASLPAINSYPWKFWLDNVGFEITEIKIIDGGSGYISQPQVDIVSDSGTGASAHAYFTNGVLNRIILVNSGSGYLSAPEIVIRGGLSQTGRAAKAVAIIGNSVIRSNLIAIKFDRTSGKQYVTSLMVSEQFTGSSSKLQFPLKWAPDVRIGNSSVTIDGVPVLRELYKLSVVETKKNNSTVYTGTVTFVKAPSKKSVVTVQYKKDVSLLNATDRIGYYYNPALGQFGSDASQLMTGVDYGGTIVGNLGFNTSGGWSDTPYTIDSWSSYDESFTDFITTIQSAQAEYQLPYTPATGTELNIYIQSHYQVDQVSDGNQLEYPYNIYVNTPNHVYAITNVAVDNASGVSKTISTVGTVSQAVILAVSGDVGQGTLVLENATNVQVGQFVSGIGVPDNTKVMSIDGTSIVLTENLTQNAIGNYNFYALSTTLLVSNTSGISVGMGIVGPGFTTQAVTKVVSSTLLVISAPPVIIPSTGTTLEFVQNVAGSYDIRLTDATNLEIGDVVSSDVPGAISYNSKIVAKDENTSVITLDSILFLNLPVDSQITVTRTLHQPVDVSINSNGTILLANPLPAGTILRTVGTFDSIRLDAPDYDSGTNSSASNPNATMATIIADGIENTFTIPTEYFNVWSGETEQFKEGDVIIFRQSTSDGSTVPNNYDTDISGGNLAYSTASGLLADDIVIDGDDFVSPTSSPAPEEVVPGQVVDTLAIKVFDRPHAGSANIKVDSYKTDGVKSEFELSQLPNTNRAVIVKLGQNILTIDEDFTVDYKNRKVILMNAPAADQLLSIFIVGFAGTGMLDIDYFVGDGVTREFITKAPWSSTIQSVVYVNGMVQNSLLFQTDDTYELNNLVGIRFLTAPPAGSMINYIIVKGPQKTFVVTNTERIIPNGESAYTLQFPIGKSLPLENSMVVRVNQRILQAPVNQYYKISNNRLTYNIDKNRAIPYSTSAGDVQVFADGKLLVQGVDYSLDLGGITVKINRNTYKKYSGTQLIVSIRSKAGYTYNPTTNQITFAEIYNAPDVIEVVGSYQHDVLDIQRTSLVVESATTLTPGSVDYYRYSSIQGGTLVLDRGVINENYVWVTKNETLLVPGVDYRLDDNKTAVVLTDPVQLQDTVTLMTYSSNVLQHSISYMQFKDMLNRTVFKRLSLDKRTTLAQDLHWNDTIIVLEDASAFSIPDPEHRLPGIIEIRGERIEYYAKDGNILSHLRRATRGTGMVALNVAGTFVQDIGYEETVPYTDTVQNTQVISDGSKIIKLNFVPEKGNNTVGSASYDPSGVAQWFSNDGYTFAGLYDALAGYPAKSVVIYNNNYYYSLTSIPQGGRDPSVNYGISNTAYWNLYETSIPVGYGQCDSVEVFVGGYDDSAQWAANTAYTVGMIVNVGSYTYRCINDHTSSSEFANDIAEWTLFVGNIRLKKKPYYLHNEMLGPYSNSSTDVRFDADFSVNGQEHHIRLSNDISVGTHVTVVKRTGVAWDSSVNILEDDTKVAEFIKAKQGIWYESYKR